MSKTVDPPETSLSTLKGEIVRSRGCSVTANDSLMDSFFRPETPERLFEKEAVRWWIEKTRIANGWEKGYKPLSWLDEMVGSASYAPPTAWLLWAMDGERINTIQYEEQLEKLFWCGTEHFGIDWLEKARNIILDMYQSHLEKITTPNLILEIKE